MSFWKKWFHTASAPSANAANTPADSRSKPTSNPHKPTPDALIRASHSGDVAGVQSLLQQGADVNAKGLKDWTALIAASTKGHHKIVQVLLAEGAEVNARSDEGENALMRASGEGHLEVVSALLGTGADLNAKSYSGATALSLASARGHSDVAKILRAKGASQGDAPELFRAWFRNRASAEDLVNDPDGFKLMMLLSMARGLSDGEKRAIVTAKTDGRFKIERKTNNGDEGFDLVFLR